jgi:hypothetical protein
MENGHEIWNWEFPVYGEIKNVYKILVGKPEGRGPLRRPQHRWEDIIKMDLQEMGWRMWIRSIWLRIRIGDKLLEHVNEPSGSIMYGEFD